MKNFSKILLIFTVGLIILWQLPWGYNFLTSKTERPPFTMYSTVVNDFVTMKHGEASLMHYGQKGDKYTQSQFDSILPAFYVRQLVADGRFPEKINNVEVAPREVQLGNFNFKSLPTDINTPKVGLYQLMESMSGRVNLKMPKDVFRLTKNGIEFIDMLSNSVDVSKSDEYTKMLLKKGVVFPILEISGNPTTRKEYDEGFLLLDNNRKLFHLKMTQSLPYVRHISLPKDVKLNHIFITEFANRKTLAFMTDVNNSFYVLTKKGYKVEKVGIPSFDPRKDALTIFGNMFDWTVIVDSENGRDYYAINSEDYSLIDRMPYMFSNDDIWSKIGKYIIPLHISFTDYFDNYIFPRVKFNL